MRRPLLIGGKAGYQSSVHYLHTTGSVVKTAAVIASPEHILSSIDANILKQIKLTLKSTCKV